MTLREKITKFQIYINWILELDLDGDSKFLTFIDQHNEYISSRLIDLNNKSQIMDLAIQLRNKYQKI